MDRKILKLIILLLLILLLICIYGTYKGNKIKEDKKNANEQTILTKYMKEFMFNTQI